jgi:uncharacterized damage-inducible protein DinB
VAEEEQGLCAALVAEIRRRLLGESVVRLKQCLAMLTDEEIWYRPNHETVSIGNLVLHLCGNIRQWILSGLANEPDTRHRQAEFDEPGPIPSAALVVRIDEVAAGVARVLDGVTPELLVRTHAVQGFEETGVAILVHVTEHFSYHVGQITYAIKSRRAVDMGYYKGVDLSKHG